jgi:hypothetical protein
LVTAHLKIFVPHQEFIFPTLLPAIHDMMNIVDGKGYPDVPKGRDVPLSTSFNPIRWLAQVHTAFQLFT